MHPDHLHALCHAGKRHGKAARHAFLRLGLGADGANKALARSPQQHRHPQIVKQRQPRQQGQIVLQGFAKADTGIHRKTVARDSCGLGLRKAGGDLE